jgi:hypothetical protein
MKWHIQWLNSVTLYVNGNLGDFVTLHKLAFWLNVIILDLKWHIIWLNLVIYDYSTTSMEKKI